MIYANKTNKELTALLTEFRDRASVLFALEAPTIEQVDEAETLVASIKDIEAEQRLREDAAKEAADRFQAARAAFAVDPEGEDEENFASEDDADAEDGAEDEAEAEDDGEAEPEAEVDPEVEAEAEAGAEVAVDSAVAAASQRKQQRVPAGSAARKVARRVARPDVASTPQVTVTVAADVPGFAAGAQLDGMEQVTKALLGRSRGFAPFNAKAAEQIRNANGGQPQISSFNVASFHIPTEGLEVATGNPDQDYRAVKAAIKSDQERGTVLTAAGWCAPSETIYTWISDYVVDGLISVPEIPVSRGSINLTTGPTDVSYGAALDDFGFDQTEAEAIARDPKSWETIECPDFVKYTLDATGYGYKIPFLTQKAYPEVITDALRRANVKYAHKMNRRVISDIVAFAGAADTTPYGGSFVDTMEALSIVAVKKRRWYNLGENAVMDVKIPVLAKEVFRNEISRRSSIAVEAVTDQQIEANFAVRNLSVEYVSDWQEMSGPHADWPGSFQALIYPKGTFVKAVEDVVNVSAVYDAASLTINEYTGVFFEQGILVAKAGYHASRVTIPICTSGNSGAAVFVCEGGSL